MWWLLPQIPSKPDGIHVHLFDHPDLCRIFFGHVTKEKIVDPSATLDQDFAAVYLVTSDCIFGKISLNLADPETGGLLI